MKKRLALMSIASLALAALCLPFLRPTPPQLWILSIGQGESILYRDSSGKLLLFDGGPDDTVLSELGHTLPPWRRHIDVIVLSHLHADHLRGLISVLGRYTVGEVWQSGATAPGLDVKKWQELIAAQHIPNHFLKAGDARELGNTHILTLHPITSAINKTFVEAHDATVVLQLTLAPYHILLTGDLNEKHEKAIMDWCQPPTCSLQSDVFQVPHHGSASGLSPPFLAAAKPRFAIICVGQNNKFSHPRPEILQKLEDAHIPYIRTDKDGGLLLTFRPDRLVSQKTGSVPR